MARSEPRSQDFSIMPKRLFFGSIAKCSKNTDIAADIRCARNPAVDDASRAYLDREEINSEPRF